ncbi:DUF5057 domain-containing protein [Exiguobacterium sp. RIT452]|uniref:DUF5057 domain-containing protein n=1 Tax=Exiguobacterium sp. RIT452 TaxID=2315552 RepID=UPI000E70A6A7|nr:DUF5057 domain-containing protein [Exiguobacterium sp. RIT452]RJP00678.1 DUF5057 domain-containing protein [Exiguobacterium sp. RIT452]
MKRWVRLFVVSLLIFTSFTYIQQPHTKAATGEKFKILEVRDAWSTTNRIDPGTTVTSMLTGLDMSRYEIKMMTVKELNASRFPLDGAFDAIVFDPSAFSGTDRYSMTVSDTKKNHNTNKIENDITKLKANEIQNAYVKKGLPVFLHQDVLTHSSSNFTAIFKETPVYTDLSTVISRLKLQKVVRPRLAGVSVQQKGTALTGVDKGTTAVPNVPIDFTYTTSAENTNQLVQLYIDFDSNDQFEESEKVDEKPAGKTGTLSYNFDAPSYTGPRNWMIRVSSSDGLTDYKTGSFLMKDQVAEAKILQVTRSGATGSINGFMNSGTLLKQDGFYDFNVEVITADTFNKTFSTKNINTSYDMLVFGFQDSYGAASLSDDASNAILAFTNTGQGLMLSHDTIFRPNQSASPELFWEKKFAGLAGQKNFTNMGYAAPRTSGQAVKQNEGVMTSYPFTLGNSVQIATTHNQYFGLDLEQPDLIPWYNIRENNVASTNQDAGRTIGDARNHYYMYTKGNVTYSGAGHTSTFNQQQEKELFSNTMYRAFIGANHKPLLKNILPENQASYLDNEPLTISYKVNDYDLRDRELKTRIYIDNEKVYENDKLKNNSFVSETFTGKLAGKTSAVIRIEAEDQRGAKTIETRTIQVVQPSASSPFTLSRSIDPATIPQGETADITYTVKTSPMLQKDAIGNNGYIMGQFSVTMEDILFSEDFPGNVEVISATGLGNVKIVNQKLTGNVPDIEYDEAIAGVQKGLWIAKPSELTFTVKVRAKDAAGVHLFDKKDNSMTSTKTVYRDKKNGVDKSKSVANDTQAFPTLGYALSTRYATEAKIPSVRIDINTPSYKVLPDINPAGSQYGTLKWSIADTSIATINQEGIIVPKKIGTTDIKLIVPVANGKELVATSKLTINDVFGGLIVRDVPNVLYVGQTKAMTGDAIMLSGTDAPIKWIVTNPGSVESKGKDTDTLSLTGVKPGMLTVQAVVPATAGATTYLAQSQVYTIEVKVPELTVNPSNLELWVGTTKDVTATFSPDIRLPFVLSKISDAIELTATGNGYTVKGLTGTLNGPIDVLLQLKDFPDTQAITKINVRENPLTLTANDLTMTLQDDQKRPLLNWLPVTTTERFYRLEVLQGKEYVKTDATAQTLKALRPGVARVKVTALKEDKSVFEVLKDGEKEKQPLTTTFKVTISSEGSAGESDTDVY